MAKVKPTHNRDQIWVAASRKALPLWQMQSEHLLHIVRLHAWGWFVDSPREAVIPDVVAELHYRGWRRVADTRCFIHVRVRKAQLQGQIYAWGRDDADVVDRLLGKQQRAYGVAQSVPWLSIKQLSASHLEILWAVYKEQTPPGIWADWLEDKEKQLGMTPDQVTYLARLLRE